MRLPDRILFVGAHCDDLELLAGGLLTRACAEHRQVGVLVFSDHRGIIDEERAAQAYSEFLNNVASLERETGTSITNHSGAPMPACSGDFERRRSEIYAAMEKLRDAYDLVVTHSAHDTNQDHQQVASEAQRVFKAHTTLLGGEFPNNDLGDFLPQVYFALSAYELDTKARMIARYRSQDFGGRPYLDESVARSLARVRGSQIRADAAEAFEVLGRVILRPRASS
jgi:LmbE family N-acetylglucosaminyl deacetylase